jgi:hypothetical protein
MTAPQTIGDLVKSTYPEGNYTISFGPGEIVESKSTPGTYFIAYPGLFKGGDLDSKQYTVRVVPSPKAGHIVGRYYIGLGGDKAATFPTLRNDSTQAVEAWKAFFDPLIEGKDVPCFLAEKKDKKTGDYNNEVTFKAGQAFASTGGSGGGASSNPFA